MSSKESQLRMAHGASYVLFAVAAGAVILGRLSLAFWTLGAAIPLRLIDQHWP